MARILAIDDDFELHSLLRVSLGKAGHTTTLTTRGEEGLALATDQPDQFDLVVLDLMMPGLDGFEVVRRLRAEPRTRDLPILVLTARSQAADHAAALESGADGFLAKPFEPEGLGRKVEEVLAQVAARRNGAAPGGPHAHVTVLLGLRGGVGATTCAVNLAGALVRRGRRTCLVELTPSGGHVALHLRLAASPNWSTLSGVPDTSSLGAYLLRHEAGLVVLAAPGAPVRHGLSAAALKAVLDALSGYFAHVVVDAAPTLDEATWAVLGAADHTVLMCSPEVGAVQTTLGTLSVVVEARKPGSTLHVAVSHVSPEPGLPLAAVERALGRRPELVVPHDRLQARALAQGSPLVFAQPNALLPTELGAYALALQEPVTGRAAA